MNLSEKKQVIDSLIEILLQNKQNIQDWLITYVNMKKHTEMLDSFYFQTKLIDAEYELVQKIYKMIENRMYGEYYKLWLAMTHYTKDLWKETVRFPPYKDLEPTKQYDSKVTHEMYEEISSIFQRLKEVTDKSQKDIDVHREQLNKGIHIENYINTLSYQLGLMVDQVDLFQNMFDSYQTYHHQRYDHFIKKIELLNAQIEGKVFPKCSQCEEASEMCKGCAIRATNYSCELCHLREPVYCKECMPQPVPVPEPVPEPLPEPLPDTVPEPLPEPLPDTVPEPVLVPGNEPLELVVPVLPETVDPVDEHVLPLDTVPDHNSTEDTLPDNIPVESSHTEILVGLNTNDKALQTETFEFLDMMEVSPASSHVKETLEPIPEVSENDFFPLASAYIPITVSGESETIDMTETSEIAPETHEVAPEIEPVEVLQETPVEITQETPVEVPQEIPVEVMQEIPVEVPQEIPVEVMQEITVEVPQEIPV